MSEILVLARRDLAALMRLPDYVAAVEEAFRYVAEGVCVAPPPMHLPLAGGGFHVKAASLPVGSGYVATKINGNFPGNAGTLRPTIQGAILLSDASNGTPLALLDSVEITTQRTGAATAIAAKHLARPDSRVATICGCGTQGRVQLEALREVLDIGRAYAWDREPGVAARYAAEMADALGIAAEAAPRLEHVASISDVIVTCTTATTPFLGPDAIRPGTFIAAVGADNPEKSEIAPALMAASRVVADVLSQCVVMGDLHHAIRAGAMSAEDVDGELADLVTGRKRGRRGRDEITLFDATGTAIQDVAAAACAYEAALARGLGQRVSLN